MKNYKKHATNRMTALSWAVSALMMSAAAYADVGELGVGDLEIYKSADSGSVTITMMLDVSKSMDFIDLPPYKGYASDGMIYTKNGSHMYQDPDVGTDVICRYAFRSSQPSGNVQTSRPDYSHLPRPPRPGFSFGPPRPGGLTGGRRPTVTKPKPVTTAGNFKRDDPRLQALWKSNGRTMYATKAIFGNVHEVSIPITDEHGKTKSDIKFNIYVCPHSPDKPNDYIVMSDGTIEGAASARRIDTLKVGFINLLANGRSLSSRHRIAIGEFGIAQQNNKGVMRIPATPLTTEGRTTLINHIAKLKPMGGTPVTQGYAEAASYMLGTTTYDSRPGAKNDHSGFVESDSSTKTQGTIIHNQAANAKGTYASPLTNSQCEGYGLYLLTDGFSDGYTKGTTENIMARALGVSSFVPGQSGLSDQGLNTQGRKNAGGWPAMSAFAKELRKQTKFGPDGLRTATVGFARDFKGFGTKIYQGKTIVDCNPKQSRYRESANLCKLGSIDEDYGKGGFTATDNADELAKSLSNFIATLKKEIDAAPSGTISIPKDPLSVENIQPYAYLPMIEPRPSENPAVWRGNLKKYYTLDGTLYGKNKVRLYQTHTDATKENTNFPFAFNKNAQDIWDNAQVLATPPPSNNNTLTANTPKEMTGGTHSQIPMPKDAQNSQRSVYVEVIPKNQPPNQKTPNKLQKVSVVNGKIQGGQELIDEGYTTTDVAYIINYLGLVIPVATTVPVTDVNGKPMMSTEFPDVPLTEDIPYKSIGEIETAIQSATVLPKANLGGVLHSVPVLASYSGIFKDGNITSDESQRDDNILYGSMDGGLHMVAAKSGEERFSFIPRAIFDDETQRLALKAGTTNKQIGIPAFGVDAPWAVNPTYATSEDGTKITATSMYAYGGLRLGGVGLYALDLSLLGKDSKTLNSKADPSMLFSINQDTKGFERMGNIWSRPLVTNIRTGANQDRRVIVFGGGYDMCYEYPKFNLNATNNGLEVDPNVPLTEQDCVTKKQMQGNAVYMVDAKTGELIASWSVSDNEHMKHSIVAEINGVDRNNNGAVDHLYVADLGGQIFRIDLSENKNGQDIKNGVTRIFDANSEITGGDKIPYRFYERPIVSFYDDKGARFGVISVSSGDRSSPLSKYRSMDNTNRVYGIFDRDVATAKAYKKSNSDYTSKDLKHNNLVYIDPRQIESGKADKAKELIGSMRSGGTSMKHGWYYNMDRFSGFINVPHLKSVGPGIVTGSIYYASIYSPEYQYMRHNSCAAGIAGGTERQMYCLPWGICADPDTGTLGRKLSNGTVIGNKNGVLGFVKAGPGIQELAMSTVTSKQGESSATGSTALISHMTFDEQRNKNLMDSFKGTDVSNSGLKESTNASNIKPDTGTDVYVPPISHGSSYRFKFQRWYDLQDAEKN